MDENLIPRNSFSYSSTSYPASSSDDIDVNDDGFIEAEGPDLYKNQNITKNIEKKQDQNALKDTQVRLI